jgi:ribosomal protein S18 acetylase RimI-like enzyme
MLLEFATREDLPELGEAVVAASAELRDRHGTPDMSRAIVGGAAYGIDHQQAVVIARDGDGICGFVIWVWFEGVSADGSVDGLGTWVARKYRRTGLGAAMRELAERRCVEAGRKCVSGIVALGNDAALESVTKAGFDVVGIAVTKRFAC